MKILKDFAISEAILTLKVVFKIQSGIFINIWEMKPPPPKLLTNLQKQQKIPNQSGLSMKGKTATKELVENQYNQTLMKKTYH